MAMFFSYIDGAETVLRGSAFIGLTGGPSADFNMALFGEDPDDLAVFDDFVSRVNAPGLSALAMISGAAGKPLYDSLGFKVVDELSIWLVGESTQFPAH